LAVEPVSGQAFPPNLIQDLSRVTSTKQQKVVRFSRIRVKDIHVFEAIHAEAQVAQEKYGVTEHVFQSVDNENDLTIQIVGTDQAVEDWLQSAERAALSSRLELDGTADTWLSIEAFEH
jgi:hypothetical protein